MKNVCVRGTTEIGGFRTGIARIATDKLCREITRKGYERKMSAIEERRIRSATTGTSVIVATMKDISRRKITTRIGACRYVQSY